MLELRVANGIGHTGGILRHLLEERGCFRPPTTPGRLRWNGLRYVRERIVANVGQTGIVCYGVPYYEGQLPVLNANAGRLNKMEQANRISGRGITGIRVYTREQLNGTGATAQLPYFGRRRIHMGGTDIKLILTPEDFATKGRGCDFFVPFIPNDAEYRVWIFRTRHKATYQKVLRYPERNRGYGRNYDNGFAFELCRAGTAPQGAVDVARRAVAALDLDFGGVDVLHGTDGRFYVVEVNTAPGVEGEGRQGIVGLADEIAAWHNNGFPRRA